MNKKGFTVDTLHSSIADGEAMDLVFMFDDCKEIVRNVRRFDKDDPD